METQQWTIYVGLNDSYTHEQKLLTEKYVSLLKKVCYNYQVAFSVSFINGGYFHADGSYVEENTLALMLMDVEESKVDDIASDLCAFFNQESVMVTKTPAQIKFISDTLKEQ